MQATGSESRRRGPPPATTTAERLESQVVEFLFPLFESHCGSLSVMSRTNTGIRFLRVRRLSVTCAAAVAVAVISLVTACDDASTTATTVTIAPARTTSSNSTPGTSAASTSTTTSTTTTTVAVTTTTTLDDLKAQIAADFQRSYLRRADLVNAPTLDNLDLHVAEVAAPGSDAFATLVAYIQDLVRLGDRVVPNDPDIFSVTVENIEFVGEPPYKQANVTSCRVSNRKRVTPAEAAPAGTETLVGDTGKLIAKRVIEPVQLRTSRCRHL
jgi:hypothetical protein